MSGSGRYVLSLLALGLLLVGGCRQPSEPGPSSSPIEPTFLGSARCAECHTQEFKEWQESHHHKAMQHPSEETVLGDFQDAEFDYFGAITKFYRKGDEFWVTTHGPEGVSQSYKVEYTFGVEPLQQYLVRFPDGRLQALSFCWDSQKKRWFHLYPDERIDFKSPLHWTSAQYTWNFMCAECHSTGVRKNYDKGSESYQTSYAEVSVSCESCHGPGSRHLDFLAGEKLPHHGFLTDLEGRGPWTSQTDEHPPRPVHPDRETDQLDTCARCHARRSLLNEPYVHGRELGQTHSVAVLSDELYHADGQIDDEVYVYGSFLQSKMYQAGVVCTDCHNPHTGQVRLQGDKMCLSCHSSSRFQAWEHSRHRDVSCIDCHMTGKVYMGHDFRRDHSFRIPNPDLSAQTGSPNACNQCHQDKTVPWAQGVYRDWYGEPRQHFGTIFHKLQTGDHSAQPEAARIVSSKDYPDIVRATAVSLVPLPEVVIPALQDESSLVRREAVKSFLGTPPEVRRQHLVPLAADPIAEVRIEVGRLLAGTRSSDPAVAKAVQEYRGSLEFNADRVESRLGMVDLLSSEGKLEEAEQELRQTLERFSKSPLAYLNGADYYRVQGNEERARELLEEGLTIVDSSQKAPLHHSLGLLLVRQKKYGQALSELKAAYLQSPENSRYALVYAVGLDHLGDTSEAVEVLAKALTRWPKDTELLQTLEAYRAKLR